VTDKCNVLPVDDLVKICVDFYSKQEAKTKGLQLRTCKVDYMDVTQLKLQK